MAGKISVYSICGSWDNYTAIIKDIHKDYTIKRCIYIIGLFHYDIIWRFYVIDFWNNTQKNIPQGIWNINRRENIKTKYNGA